MKPLFGLGRRGVCRVPETPPEFCRLLELPGEVLDGPSVRECLRSCAGRGIEWGVRDLLDPGLSRRLAEEGDHLRIEAFRKLGRRADVALANGAKWASLDFDAGRAATDAAYAALLRPVLLQTGGVLAGCGGMLPLLLPVRIPAPGGAAEPERLLKFRHGLPLPGMGLVFELHPHEPGALEWAGRELLRFEARWWRLCFDPASGNQLSAGVLRRFLDFGGDAPEPLRVIFSPECAVWDDFTLKQLSETVEKWGG